MHPDSHTRVGEDWHWTSQALRLQMLRSLLQSVGSHEHCTWQCPGIKEKPSSEPQHHDSQRDHSAFTLWNAESSRTRQSKLDSKVHLFAWSILWLCEAKLVRSQRTPPSEIARTRAVELRQLRA
eukprot:6215218-Amphidinium_carterae.2